MNSIRLPLYFLMTCGLVIFAMGAGPHPRDDDWPRYGHDARLTGRSSLKGDITEPRVAWTFPTAGRDLYFELIPAAGQHPFTIPPESPAPPIESRVLQTPPVAMRDTDGSGTLRYAPESSHERWAKFLPDVRGLQRVAWNNTWTDNKDARIELFAYDQGFDKPRRMWASEFEKFPVMSPIDIVYDIDGDGVPEILVAAHYRLMIYDGATGRKETNFQYHEGRPYGWFGLADVDGDGQVELITIGDFQSHIDVVKFDRTKPEGSRLSVLWRRDIGLHIQDRDKWPQIGPHPVADVTGDGKPEIIFNLYNDTGDDQWHTVVFNAATGDAICDIPKRVVQGVADADGDGSAELFLATAEGPFAPTFAAVELAHIRDRKPVVVWSASPATWMTADLPQPGSTWATTGTAGNRHVLLTDDKRPIFMVQTPPTGMTQPAGTDPETANDVHTLLALQCTDSDHPQVLWQVHGLPGQVEALAFGKVKGTDQTGVSLRVRTPVNTNGTISGEGIQAHLVQTAPFQPVLSGPVAGRLKPDGPMIVAVEGAGPSIITLSPPTHKESSPHVHWQRAGRGMSNGGHTIGPVIADLLGDGHAEVLMADHDAIGQGRVLAVRDDGSLLWQHLFVGINGLPPVGNTCALSYFWPGHFRGQDHLDVFVNTRRGPMHSDVGQLLDGRDGHLVWTKQAADAPGVFHWGYAGTVTAVVDMNDDGFDDLISLFPVCFWIADGRTGDFLVAKDISKSPPELPSWAAYGTPLVYDMAGGPESEVLLDSPYIVALLDKTGKPIWHGPPASQPTPPYVVTTPIHHSLVDFDGDGRLGRRRPFELASGGYGDEVHVIDPPTGNLLWKLKAPVPTSEKVAAADIDGRKGDELIYTAGNDLCVITGDRTSGKLLWKWTAPSALSMPAIADIDGDGLAEIILQSADGTVYCIDGPVQ